MAYDTARSRIVLFGGDPVGETWEWDGSSWLKRAPASAPISDLSTAALAFDVARGRTVLFNGNTWEWDGTTWTKRAPPTSPPSFVGSAMAYDATRSRIVLFGGDSLGQTWEWDGTTWTKRTPAVSPPSSSGSSTSLSLAYDGSRKRIVLSTGQIGASGIEAQTWEWDGTTWTNFSPPFAPRFGLLAYDSGLSRVVLYDGLNLWEWDGAVWATRVLASKPPGRSGGALAFDAARGRLVLHGGYMQADTWDFGP